MEPSSPPSHAAAAASQRCSAAADATAHCASDCLADPRVYDLEECIDWCLLGSQMLGSCAQALDRPPTGGRSEAIAAAARAALLAAEGCRAAASDHTSTLASCGVVAEACGDAVEALRAYLETEHQRDADRSGAPSTLNGSSAPQRSVGAQTLTAGPKV